jgi:hypothetical protein
MLTRFRIEVEGADSAAACEEELAKYEHALQVIEYDASLPGYRGRRVVRFKRIDTRSWNYGRADQSGGEVSATA